MLLCSGLTEARGGQPNIIPIWHFFSGGTWEDGRLVTPEERGVRHNYLALLAGDKSVQVHAARI